MLIFMCIFIFVLFLHFSGINRMYESVEYKVKVPNVNGIHLNLNAAYIIWRVEIVEGTDE